MGKIKAILDPMQLISDFTDKIPGKLRVSVFNANFTTKVAALVPFL